MVINFKTGVAFDVSSSFVSVDFARVLIPINNLDLSKSYKLIFDVTSSGSTTKILSGFMSSSSTTYRFDINGSYHFEQVISNLSGSTISLGSYTPGVSLTFTNLMLVELTNNVTNYENYNQEICVNKLDEQNKSIQEVNNTLNNDDVPTGTGTDFFNDFSVNNHGLSGIITSPIRLINSLSSSTCSPLIIPLPLVIN